jgi:hypothetical protein
MEDYRNQIEILDADVAALEHEIRRELFAEGEGWTGVIPIIKEGGYSEQLNRIREQIWILMENIRSRLRTLGEVFPSSDGDDFRSFKAGEEIHALNNLQSQLLAVWARLESLIDLIGIRQAAPAGQPSGPIAKLKAWLSALASWIKRISGQLWQLLSRLMTPKEWKLSGDIGTGPFGLANVGIEITFG